MIIYKRDTGDILKVIPNEIDIQTLYYHFPQEFKENLEGLDIEDYPTPLFQYKVINGELIKRSVEEIKEMQQYGKILTEEERQALTPTLDDFKNQKISDSKIQLTSYLQNNPLLFSDGKYYSVTQEKQNLLNNAITVYQMKTQLGLPAELKWNSTGEECSVWTLEDAISLALGVANYVEPLVAYQQSIEVQIRNCTTREELESIVINYETV